MRRALASLRTLASLLVLCLAVPCAPLGAAEADETAAFYLLLIHQARADGRPRAALAYLSDFERRYPGNRDARILRINCLLDLGQVDTAEVALSALGDSPTERAVRGHVLAAHGNWTAAIPLYLEARAASPTDPLTGNALGYAQLRAGQVADAVETLKAAADLAPTNSTIRNNLLLALALSGRADEAEAAIRKLPDAGERARLRQSLGAEADRLTALGGA